MSKIRLSATPEEVRMMAEGIQSKADLLREAAEVQSDKDHRDELHTEATAKQNRADQLRNLADEASR